MKKIYLLWLVPNLKFGATLGAELPFYWYLNIFFSICFLFSRKTKNIFTLITQASLGCPASVIAQPMGNPVEQYFFAESATS